MSSDERPLSPHLQVYKPQLTSILSILHRMFGVTLMMGMPFLMYWLGAAAYGPEVYAQAQAIFGSWYGIIGLMGWSYALCYHMCNGIRHLFWDAGFLLPIEQVYASGYVMLVASAGIWAAIWGLGWYL